MEIILKQNIAGLGHKDDILVIKSGYGRNHLIPKGYAIVATPSAKKVLAETIRQRAHKEAKIKNEALELAAKLEAVKLEIGAKTSSTGKIFGSVNNIQIAEALALKGIEIDRKIITIEGDVIKEVGNYTASVKLHREVSATVAFEVIAE
jgi:large subunit ribosomal protein L9